jgi:hypothetical protein
MSQQETVTDRLVGVIQSIQMAQEDGVLSVKRGEGNTFEEGSIVFVNGQIKQTISGRRTGTAALNWLSTWGRCHYTFTASNGRQTQPLDMTTTTVTEHGRAFAGDLRSGGPVRRPAEPLLPRSGVSWERRPQPPPASPIYYPTRPLAAALRAIEQGQLSRAHRQLFLLIDGRRGVQELAHLAAKNEQDVQALLRDLERISIIGSGGH